LSVYSIHYFAALSYIIYPLSTYALFLRFQSQGKKDKDPLLLPASFLLSVKTRKSNPHMINLNVCYTIASTSLLCGNYLQRNPNLSIILLRVSSGRKLLASNICRDKVHVAMVSPADHCSDFRKKFYHPNTSLDAYSNTNWDLTVQRTMRSQTHHPVTTF